MLFEVILDNIRSIYNVGSIFRTADAAGIAKIYLAGVTPSPSDRFGKIRPQFSKVSLGAEKYISWEKVASTVKLIGKLKSQGYKILALEQSSESIPYYKLPGFMKLSKRAHLKLAIIAGNEVKGLSKTILKKADIILEIPMRGSVVREVYHPKHSRKGKESLNVAIAFGIAAFHIINS